MNFVAKPKQWEEGKDEANTIGKSFCTGDVDNTAYWILRNLKAAKLCMQNGGQAANHDHEHVVLVRDQF